MRSIVDCRQRGTAPADRRLIWRAPLHILAGDAGDAGEDGAATRHPRGASMSNPYIGEIRMFAGNFAPVGWNFCDGSLMPISGNEALFQLIGTTYGGDGQSTFALPDLRGRLPLHIGTGFVIGQSAGVETVTLTTPQIPSHQHSLTASTVGSVASPANAFPGPTSSSLAQLQEVYGAAASLTSFNPATIGASGSSQPHTNFQPYLCVNFIISLFGIFPTQN
jgi:microcystin-dependent protein